MLFQSFPFLFFFLPVTLLLYWAGSSRIWRQSVILVASYVFYGFWDYRFCGLLLFSSMVDYIVGLKIERSGSPSARCRGCSWRNRSSTSSSEGQAADPEGRCRVCAIRIANLFAVIPDEEAVSAPRRQAIATCVSSEGKDKRLEANIHSLRYDCTDAS